MNDRALVEALVTWYREARRALPWRASPDPYAVLLSEQMLQQTRVETAIPYFERFLSRWPTLADLAGASEDEVVEAWAGLGYYRRARHLHRCAVAAVARGGLPADRDALRELPGIGPYTAGAIASIAFGQRVPVVDGNVERVLSRLDARLDDPRATAGRRALWARAEALHAACEAPPGDLNQALMELGATVCTPRAPRCATCPVAGACEAHAQGIAESLPRKAPRREPSAIRGVAGVAWVGDRVWLGRRSPGGLLGGLWEPLRADLTDDTPPLDALRRQFEAMGLAVEIGPAVAEVVHVFTHRRLTCAVHRVRVLNGLPVAVHPYDRVAAVTVSEVGLSTLARKLLSAARSG